MRSNGLRPVNPHEHVFLIFSQPREADAENIGSCSHVPIRKVAHRHLTAWPPRPPQPHLHFTAHSCPSFLPRVLSSVNMKISSFTTLLSLLLLTSFSAALQFCKIDEEKKTDLCLALASSHNTTTHAKDLSLHLSVQFPARNTGWAAVGVGEEMKGALMFVLYPGIDDGCSFSPFSHPTQPKFPFYECTRGKVKLTANQAVAVSIRSTSAHISPTALAPSERPDIHVTRAWVDSNGLYNAQIMCYDCESWGRSKLDVMSGNQSWIWSVNTRQKTRSDDVGLHLVMHTNRGLPFFSSSVFVFVERGAGAGLTRDRNRASRYGELVFRIWRTGNS